MFSSSSIKGKTEFDIFKNYYSLHGDTVRNIISNVTLQSKDDSESSRYRALGNCDFKNKSYYNCLHKYTKSLSYATYNGAAYAMALANRSATYFELKNYKSCIVDVDLSLQADYPALEKPKLLIRKANCFNQMKNCKKTLDTIEYCVQYIKEYPNMPKNRKDSYKKDIEALLLASQIASQKQEIERKVTEMETIQEQNVLNPNISAAITLKFNKKNGVEYLANRDIKCSEILFVEETYTRSFVKNTDDTTAYGIFFCDYCWKEAKNCIPCKNCITNILYCSENCRDTSWQEFHQWECDLIRSKQLEGLPAFLSLRTLIKAACSGAIYQIANNSGAILSTKNMDPYLNIYSFNFNIKKFFLQNIAHLEEFCKEAVVVVEYLKKTKFFNHLMSNKSCNKDYNELVLFSGGLLLKLNAQSHRTVLNVKYAAPVMDQVQNEIPLDYNSNFYCYALCPTVLGLQHSCESNTCIYFHKKVCVVRARTDIKAGSKISRLVMDIDLSLPFQIRKRFLQEFNIKCSCTACTDEKYNIDILEHLLCPVCQEYTIYPSSKFTHIEKVCNCKETTESFMVLNKFNETFFKFDEVETSLNVSLIKECLETFKQILHPHSTPIINAYDKLVFLYLFQGDFAEFKDALNKFKELIESKKKFFATGTYLNKFIGTYRVCYLFLQFHKNKMHKKEIMDMLTYFEAIVKEAKTVIAVENPPMLCLLTPIEMYLHRLHIKHIYLEDIN